MATASIGFVADLVAKVEKAKRMRGTRILTLLVPCLDGWGLPDDGGLRASRFAVESGAFPLYEIEDGTRYTLNHASKSRPVSDYLALQRRYAHMQPDAIADLQAEIDQGWARLQARVKASDAELEAA